MENTHRLFLGLTLGRRQNWEQFFAEPTATRSTKPESVAKEVTKKKAAREALAHLCPVSGTVTSCVILDASGDTVFTAAAGFDSVPGAVSAQVLQLLSRLLPQDAADCAGYDNVQNQLFGLRIRERMRIMVLDALRHGVERDIKVNVPVSLWYHRPFTPAPFCDPYEAIIPSELRNDVPFDGLCEFLGIDIPATADVDADAHIQAELARQLALRGQLINLSN